MVRLGFRRLCSFLLYPSPDRCVYEVAVTLAVDDADLHMYLENSWCCDEHSTDWLA